MNDNEIDLMTPAEVAKAFRVDNKTVVRWLNAGKLEGVKTPGGHARFRRDSVMALINKSVKVESEPATAA
jgi:excisionase family DNA binding protein